ncbi:MAG TPA: HAMP domain-containing sensor histidine kinase [Micromonosporaceae bacterium]|nr:HAMP domain-containing sensor histidine kinase [Micromonosporaceae bacterium]
MTIYGTRAPHRPRPTLRVRLALINGAVLGAVALALVIISTVIGRHRVATDIVAVAVITLAGVAAGYLVIARALRPLQRVTATAQRLSGETLDQRINYTGTDDEVAELAATFDAMLDRLSAAFETQKRFVANASHELRTPLAVMRTEIDVTMSDPEADMEEFRRMGTVVRDASERANALVDSLLVLARSEAQAGRRLVRKVPVDLADGATAALSAVGREVGRLGLEITTDLRPALVVGDPSLLERLAGNLIENAVRYNHGQGRVWVRTETDGAVARLVVGNTGFEVEPADVPKLFEAFRRGVRDRTGSGRGAGLGLSIVRAVTDAHGGTVRAEPLTDGGLEVVVTLPAASATPIATGSASVSAVAGAAEPNQAGAPRRPYTPPADSADQAG